jgi:hypothetical protein
MHIQPRNFDSQITERRPASSAVGGDGEASAPVAPTAADGAALALLLSDRGRSPPESEPAKSNSSTPSISPTAPQNSRTWLAAMAMCRASHACSRVHGHSSEGGMLTTSENDRLDCRDHPAGAKIQVSALPRARGREPQGMARARFAW